VSLPVRKADRIDHENRGEPPPPGHVMAEPTPTPTTAELFERAVRLHAARLIVVARAVVGRYGSAEDVVQQALMNLYRHRERYDWREPVGLLRRTVVNEALRVLRQPRASVVAEDPADASASRRAPDGPLIRSETVEQVRQAIARLPEHFRAALVLCEYEGMDYAQIADVLGASVPQVKTWLHRGRRQLAVMLKPLHDADVKDATTAGRRTVG
jgi:RNA polymerase sigma-70 factor (ECF subfamily)